MLRELHIEESNLRPRGMSIVILKSKVCAIQGSPYSATDMSSMTPFSVSVVSIADVLDDLPLGDVVCGSLRSGSGDLRAIRVLKETTHFINTCVACEDVEEDEAGQRA
jgi:hypothetical protein